MWPKRKRNFSTICVNKCGTKKRNSYRKLRDSSFNVFSGFCSAMSRNKRFVSFCISLIFTYCLFAEKMVTIEIYLLNFFERVKMLDKMAISAIMLKIVEKDPF